MRYVTEKEPLFPDSSKRRYEVIGEYGEFYWLKSKDANSAPWTSPKNLWEDVQPEVGDLWAYGVSSVSKYRVVGVDEKRGVFNMVPLTTTEADGPVVVPQSGQHESWMSSRVIYVRPLPEESLILLERPE